MVCASVGKCPLSGAGSWVSQEGARPPSRGAMGQMRETSSATMSAAACVVVASATLCPAHSERASMSPVVPSSGIAEVRLP